MKYSLGVSNFLEEISSLSHSIVFLYFFALITEEIFFYLSLLSFGTLNSNGCIFPLLFCFLLLFFSQLFVRLPQTATGLIIFFVVLMTVAIYGISVPFKGLFTFVNSNAVVFMLFYWWNEIYIKPLSIITQWLLALHQRKTASKTVLVGLAPLFPILTSGSSIWMCVAEGAWEGNDTPVQYSCLENTMGGGAW